MGNQGEIILYQPDEAVKLEVRLEDETVWLTQEQIADLFAIPARLRSSAFSSGVCLAVTVAASAASLI